VTTDATERQQRLWAEETASETIDPALVARWLDAIRQRKPTSPGAYYNACRANAKRKQA
jgi:hypothetical protein